MQPIVHKTLYGVPETKGSPVSKGLAGAIGTVPEALLLKQALRRCFWLAFHGFSEVFGLI